MKLTKKEVEHVAKLARIRISRLEEEKFTEQLSSILEYVNQLSEVDTRDIPETAQVALIENATRKDAKQDSPKEMQKKIIENFPESEDNLLKTKSVF